MIWFFSMFSIQIFIRKRFVYLIFDIFFVVIFFRVNIWEYHIVNDFSFFIICEYIFEYNIKFSTSYIIALDWSSSRVSISLFEIDSTFDFNFWTRLEKSISKLKLDSKLDSISISSVEIDSNRQKIENLTSNLALF